MASRVNVKFVAGLASGLVVLFALAAFLGYKALTHSGQDYIDQGDALLAQGKYQDASDAYAKAVFKERTRVDWLTKWQTALLKTTPDIEVEYDKSLNHNFQILETLATLQPEDPKPQRAYLDAMMNRFKLLGSNVSSWQGLADKTTEHYERLRPGEPGTEAIRRYRGLADLQLMQALSDRDDIRAQALDDLRAAVAADPNDIESAVGIIRWHVQEWLRHRRERHPEKADLTYAAMNRELAALREKHPNDLEVVLTCLSAKVDQALQSADTVEQRTQALKDLAGSEKDVLDALAKTPPESVTAPQIEMVGRALDLFRPETANTEILAEVDRVLQVRPTEPLLLRFSGVRLAGMGRLEDAIARFQRIVDLPDLPVSVEGSFLRGLRVEAVFQQATAWLTTRDRATTEQQRNEALAQVKAKRAALIERVTGGERSRYALLLDSMIGLTEGRADVSITKLAELDSQTTDTEALKPTILNMLAQALRQQNQPGAAREKYERLLTFQPNNYYVLVEMARITDQLQDLDASMRYLEAADHLAPESDPIKPMIKGMMEVARAKRGETESVTDPILKALAEVDKLTKQTPPDFEAARAVLQAVGEAHPDDTRPYQALVQIEAMSGDLDALRAAVDKAHAKFPDNPTFRDFVQRLDIISSKDRLAAIIEFIDHSDAPPPLKALRKADVYKSANRPEDASKALAEAESLAPNDPAVVETKFLNALADKRFDEAKELADRAAKFNIDLAGGLVYDARLQLAKNDTAAGLATLERAAEKLPYNALVWRMLGELQSRKGQVDRAVASLARAYKYQPQDMSTAMIYAQSLVNLQRDADALVVAREAHKIHRADRNVSELWVMLEESAGDRDVAIQERQRRHSADPNDLDNSIGLIRLLLYAKQWKPAMDVIEELRSSAMDRIDLAAVEARWNAAQGGAGVDAGLEIFKSAIAAIPPDKMDVKPYLMMAQYLLEFKREDAALAALDEAAKHQSPSKMEADSTRADYLFTARRFEAAVPVYQKLVDAGVQADDSLFYRLRLAEALVRMGNRWDDAEKALASVPQPDKEKKDMRVALLQSEVAQGKGDLRRARELLKEAVTLAPNDPRPYIQRAMFNLGDDEQFNDVMQDLEQALRLQPTSLLARNMRTEMFRRRGMFSEVISELRSGIELNPGSDELRFQLLVQLLQLDRDEDARSVADQAVADRPDNAMWLREAGNVYSRTASRSDDLVKKVDFYNKAAEYYKKSNDLESTDTAVYLYASCLLNAGLNASATKQKEFRENCQKQALAILEKLGSNVDKDGLLLVLKGRALMAGGKSAEGKDAAARGLLILQSDAEVKVWMEQVQKMFPGMADLIAFMSKLNPPQNLNVAFQVGLARFQLTDEKLHPEVFSRLNAVKTQTQDKLVLSDLYHVLGTLQYQHKLYKEAAESFAAGLAVAPDDIDFNNNLAFTLAKQLGDVQGAVAPAERAIKLAPTSSTALDTLGWVYYQLNRYSQAEAILVRAVAAAGVTKNPAEECPAKLHLAMVKWELKEKEKDAAIAQRYAKDTAELVSEVQKVLTDFKQFRIEYQPDLDALMARMKAAE